MIRFIRCQNTQNPKLRCLIVEAVDVWSLQWAHLDFSVSAFVLHVVRFTLLDPKDPKPPDPRYTLGPLVIYAGHCESVSLLRDEGHTNFWQECATCNPTPIWRANPAQPPRTPTSGLHEGHGYAYCTRHFCIVKAHGQSSSSYRPKPMAHPKLGVSDIPARAKVGFSYSHAMWWGITRCATLQRTIQVGTVT